MYSHLSCIRQIARKLPRVCQPLDSQLASQTYMYFIIERECFYAIMLCFVDEKLQKLQSGWGSAPDPDGGAYSAPPYPLAGREGATPPPAPTPVLNQFHLIAFPNPPVSRSAYGPASVRTSVRPRNHLFINSALNITSNAYLATNRNDHSHTKVHSNTNGN